MVLKIDFNNPQILHGHLEQALPQCELSKVEGIFVGRRGGLVYELFTQPRLMATGVRANSMNDMAVIRTYWDAVQRYIQSSSEHAKKHGFGLVSVDHDRLITNGLDLGSFVYCAGIGDENIESFERFDKFLQMIKEGRPKIEEDYGKVCSAAIAVKDL